MNNALGTQTTTTTSRPGQVKQLAIGVLLNQSAKGVDVTTIESMVKAAVGFNATRGDTLSVTRDAVQHEPAAGGHRGDEAATKAAAARPRRAS